MSRTRHTFSYRVRSPFRKCDVQAWANKHLPGWRVQRNDNLDGWELFNPNTGNYADWQFVKEVVDAAKKAGQP